MKEMNPIANILKEFDWTLTNILIKIKMITDKNVSDTIGK